MGTNKDKKDKCIYRFVSKALCNKFYSFQWNRVKGMTSHIINYSNNLLPYFFFKVQQPVTEGS